MIAHPLRPRRAAAAGACCSRKALRAAVVTAGVTVSGRLRPR